MLRNYRWILFFAFAALAAVLILAPHFLLPIDSLARRWSAGIGLLFMIFAMVFLHLAGEQDMFNAMSCLSSKSDELLKDQLYCEALRIVDAAKNDESAYDDDTLRRGVDFLVSNGIEEKIAEQNLNIVLGSIIIDRSAYRNVD